ncbi:MAG: lycopene cyclase domain-containing protein [Candidatus Omnitrophica bacterium]|nr:lycopene cyclase domain-containing protein [Candidatus Omnitrophota bacterium]
MKEYTVLAIFSVLLTVIVDHYSKVKVLQKKKFYGFLLIILCFKLLVNGFLTGADIVIYNPLFFLGVRIGSIPVEDFIFGFSMVSLTIIYWEYFKARFPCKGNEEKI